MKFSFRVSLPIMAVMVLLDQMIKFWVRANVPLHHSRSLIPNLLDFTHVENKGVSFSMLGGLPEIVRVPILVGISLLAVVLLAFYWLRYRRDMKFSTELAFILILSGAMGNLIDRSLYGTVTDFFHFRFYDTSMFVNNIADIFISAGVVSYLVGVIGDSKRPIY